MHSAHAFLRRKCRQDGIAVDIFTAYNIDIAVPYPNVRVQAAAVVLRGAVIKNRIYASGSQHELCGQALLKAQGPPWHPCCRSGDSPLNTTHLMPARLTRKLVRRPNRGCG